VTLRFNIYARTDIGRVRTQNQDHLLVGRLVKNRGWMSLSCAADDDFIHDYGLLLAVADGMGGENGGATASRLTLVTLDREFHTTMKGADAEDFRRGLAASVEAANRAVVHAAEVNPALINMGTTLSGICFTPSRHWLFHCGDSRVYRSRNRMLKLLTVDDTVAERNARLGLSDASIGPDDPTRSILTNCIGRSYASCHIEAVPELQAGDSLLICSDGLHGLVSEDVIGRWLSATDLSPEEIGVGLLQKAMDAGGTDNVSLVVINMAEPE
jgi:PPM family protein phosphatase